MNLIEELAAKFGVSSPDELFGGNFGVVKTAPQTFYDYTGLSGQSYTDQLNLIAEKVEKNTGYSFKSYNESTGQFDRLFPTNYSESTGQTTHTIGDSFNESTGQFSPTTYFSIPEFRTEVETLDEKFKRLSGKIQVTPDLLLSTMRHSAQPDGFIGQWVGDLNRIKYDKDFGAYIEESGGNRFSGIDSYSGSKDGGFFGLVKGMAADVGKFVALAAAAYGGAAALGGAFGGAAAASAAPSIAPGTVGVSVAPGASFAGGGTFAPGSLEAIAAGANYGGISVAPTAVTAGGFNIGAAGAGLSLFDAPSAFNFSDVFNSDTLKTAKNVYSGVSKLSGIAQQFGSGDTAKPAVKSNTFGNSAVTVSPTLNGQFVPAKTSGVNSGFVSTVQEKSGPNIYLIAAAILGGVYILSKKGK